MIGRPKGKLCIYGHVLTQGKNRQYCRTCKRSAIKRWKKSNPERAKESKRNTQLKQDFNMTTEQYDNLLLSQNGLCAACGEPLPTKESTGFPPVDHDHETNKIRGIVHTKCNRGMGLFNDNPERMRKVAEYLERNKV